MSTVHRVAVLMWTTIGVGAAGIIHFRVGVDHLYPMAAGGPFSGAVDLLSTTAPLALVIIWLGVAAWTVAGGVREERVRVRRGPR